MGVPADGVLAAHVWQAAITSVNVLAPARTHFGPFGVRMAVKGEGMLDAGCWMRDWVWGGDPGRLLRPRRPPHSLR